jgi:hypothetical protein
LVAFKIAAKQGITLHSREIDSIQCVGDFVTIIGRKARSKIGDSGDE